MKIMMMILPLLLLSGLGLSGEKREHGIGGKTPQSGRTLTRPDSGPYEAGFRPVYRYDYARSHTPATDYEGRPVAGPTARPMPIYLWYPAAKGSSSRRMVFADYVFLRSVEDEFGALTGAKKTIAGNWYRRYSGAPGATEEAISAVLAQPMSAIRDAAPAGGKFPLIIYAPGYSEGGHENTVLAEYLAGHGYVVAMTPMRGAFSRAGDDFLTTVEAQTRDLGFVLAEVRKLANVDARRIGFVGFDEGGLAAALAALHNYAAAAVACLDCSIGYRASEITARFPYFSGSRLRSAYLELLGSVKKFQRNPETYRPEFYDGIRYADAWSVRFKRLAHDEFTSDHLMNYVGGSPDGPFGATEIKNDYAAACRYVRHFLDAYVKGDARGMAFLRASPHAHGLPAGVVEMMSKEGLRVPPTEREFVELVERKGINKAIEVYGEFKRRDNQWALLREPALNRVGYQLLRANRISEAIEIFSLNVEAHPTSSNVYDSLAEAYMRAGKREAAIANYEKSLALDPQNTNAAEMLRRLRGGR